MLEQLKYKNHLNEVFEFGKDGIYIDTNTLHDYEWTVEKKNERITNMYRKIGKRKLPVKILCHSEAAGIAARNKLFEVVEKDVLAMQHGQIILGGYYFKCFVTGSKKKDYQRSKNITELELTLTSDYPVWVRENSVSFDTMSKEAGRVYLHDTIITENFASVEYSAQLSVGEKYAVIWDGVEYERTLTKQRIDGVDFLILGNVALFASGEDTGEPFCVVMLDNISGNVFFAGIEQHRIEIREVGEGGTVRADYPLDYPFEYYVKITNDSVSNTDFTASNFRLIIYGECANPSISIAGHTYKVNCSVGENEYLTIDSSTKKIYLTSNTGEVTNKFNSRSREDYIFEKIPTGTHEVVWDGSFGFDVILLEERSEPKWT